MNISKPIASLSPGLLARKGGARPAMRSQLQPIRLLHGATARQMDDLGWNDMGQDADEIEERATPFVATPGAHNGTCIHGAEIVALNPVDPAAAASLPQAMPEVVRRQRGIAVLLAGPASPRQSALAKGRRAAFTLRLDAERHLKLRLACTVSNRSAQQIVTEALDRFIEDRPELTALAQQIRNTDQDGPSPVLEGDRP
jgi:hypothetical protein